MTVRFPIRTMLLAAAAGALAIATAAPALAGPGDWQPRGGNAGDRDRGERGENRWGNGGERQQAPVQQPVPQARPAQSYQAPAYQPRSMPSQPVMSQPVQSQPAQVQQRGPGSWQNGNAASQAPSWRNDTSRSAAEAIRTRPYNAEPGPAGQMDWRNREADRNGGIRNERPNGGGTPSWQTGQRNGDASRWNRNGSTYEDRDGNRNGESWNSRNGSNNGWNDRNRNPQGWSRGGSEAWSGRDADRRDWGRNSDGRRWNDGWRRDNRYDWSSWRNQHRSVFHPGYYSAPFRGYSYSALSIGIFLGAPFYAPQYWINDPWAYRLPAAYGPYRWVRYYDDVILVDIYSGEVVDVIHDFFW